MTRDEILLTAKQYITVDRAATHGDAEDSFQKIAELWNGYIYDVHYMDVELKSADIAMMMVLFKLARIYGNPLHIDSYVDACGYLAIAGELRKN